MKNKILIITAIGCFVCGYFAGREHLKYEMRSVGREIGKMFQATFPESSNFSKTEKNSQADRIKNEYVKLVSLTDISSRREKSFRGELPVVRGRLKNLGDKALRRVEVTAYFLDEGGKRIFENSHPAVLAFDQSPPLRTNYIQEFAFLTEGVPAEWNGNVEVAVTDLEFDER